MGKNSEWFDHVLLIAPPAGQERNPQYHELPPRESVLAYVSYYGPVYVP